MVWERGTGQEAIFTQAGLTSTLLRLKIAVQQDRRTKKRREREGWDEGIDPSTVLIPKGGGAEGRRDRKQLMVFPPVVRFLCKTLNRVKFIFFAASVLYKGSFNLFLLRPVGDPRSFIPFFLLFFPFVLSPFSPRCLSLFLLLSPVFPLSFLPLWKWVF